MSLSCFMLPGDVLVCCQPEWLPTACQPGDLNQLFSKVLHVPSNIAWLQPTIEELGVILANMPLSIDLQRTLAIVASDLLTNAMSHGKDNVERIIDVGIQYIPRVMVSIGITDLLGPMPLEAFTLDPTTVDKLIELSEHGRGIFIARTIGDFVVYNPYEIGPEKEVLVAVRPDREEVRCE